MPSCSISSRRVQSLARTAALVMALSLLAACASTPPPTDTINRAQSMLDAAKQAGAADYDPVDLDFAGKKFDQAQAAMAQNDYDQAHDLAEESVADSQLAMTKSQLANVRDKVKKAAAENARLRQQLLEKQQASQSAAPAAPAQDNSQNSDGTELPQQVLPMPSAPAPASSAGQTTEGGQ